MKRKVTKQPKSAAVVRAERHARKVRRARAALRHGALGAVAAVVGAGVAAREYVTTLWAGV